MNNITRIGIKAFSVVLFVLLLTTAHAAATTVSIAGVTAELGDTVTIPIMVNNITDYGSGTIRIWYDYQVVHVTDVTGSPESQVAANYIDNSIGYASISASNLYGVSGDIAFANVEFTAVGFGSSLLDLTVSSLYDTTSTNIPRSISDGSITVEPVEPPKPFFVYGYTCYENGTPCNNPTVNITNPDNGKSWTAGVNGNYYQISLTSGSDLNVDDVLRFDATDGTNSNVTDHTVTADEVDGGGLFDFNLTIESTTDPEPSLVIYTITDTTISPNGDGIEDDTEIDVEFSESVDAAILIEDATGVIKTLYTDSGVTDPDPQTWDGTDDGSNIVADGTYQVNVTMDDGVNPVVYNNTRSIIVETPVVDPEPSLVTYTISNTVISPNGDGIMDDTEIDVEFSELVDAAILIEDATGVIKTLYTGSDVTDPDSQTWDGTDEGGSIVADGTYQVNVTMDDGVNQVVYDNTRSITVMVDTITTSVSIADTTVEPGDVVIVPLMINDITDYGAGTINITYDQSVVHVTDVISSSDSTVGAFNNNNVAGFTAISASNTAGASGDIVFANVEFTAVGNSGDSTPLNLDVTSLYDRLFTTIPTIVDDGSFTIQSLTDPEPSLVTYTISNTVISPNGDGIMDDTEIDVEFSELVAATIRIENATGVIKTLYTDSGVTDPDPQTWDGTDDGSNIVADGTYQVNVTMDDGVNPVVYNNTRSIIVETPVVDPSPSLVIYTISNTTISPDGDGIMDDTEIDVEFSEPVDAAILIEDATGVIKTLYTGSGVTDPDPQTWDGTDDGGNTVADGTYQVNVTMDDGVNQVVYDNTRSIIVETPVVDPSPSLVTYTISNTTISPNGDGIEDDTEIDVEFSESVTAAIRIEDATGIIKTLYEASDVTNPDPQTWDGTDDSNNVVTDGTYQVNVTMDDGVNQLVYNNTRSIIVETPVVDPEPSLVTYTISNTTISPNGDGIEDDTEIDVEFSESVTAAIRIEDASSVIKTLYTGSDVTDPDPQTWDGTDDGGNIVTDGTYYVNVTMDDGVNPVVYDNTRSIRVRTGPEVEVDIGCGIIYPHPYPGCSTTLPITLRGIIDYGAGTVNLYYDASIVEVSNVTSSEDSSVKSWNVVTPGWLMISALNATGVSGDVVFANVVFDSVGYIGECSDLNLTVDTLGDIYYEELPYFTTNCSICIEDPYAPVVSKPSANPDTILNDNGRARAPGTNVSMLSVVVTDANGIASVTINLSSILGPGNDSVPMTNVIGTDEWTVEVNAPYDAGVDQVHNLAVNATDHFGNSNTGKTIELTVLRRGDVVRDNKVNMFDYLYIARYTVGLEPAPDELVAGIVPADSHNGVNMLDALYIARHTVNLESAP